MYVNHLADCSVIGCKNSYPVSQVGGFFDTVRDKHNRLSGFVPNPKLFPTYGRTLGNEK